jgi:hypothetical protein
MEKIDQGSGQTYYVNRKTKATQWTMPEELRVQITFRSVDTSGDGFIDSSELVAVRARCNISRVLFVSS